MKQSDLAHLRRLLGWVRCEIGQSPEEFVATVRNIAEKLGHPQLDADQQRCLVQDHDRARAVPKYVRAAVRALERTVGTAGLVVDVSPGERVQDIEGPPA